MSYIRKNPEAELSSRTGAMLGLTDSSGLGKPSTATPSRRSGEQDRFPAAPASVPPSCLSTPKEALLASSSFGSHLVSGILLHGLQHATPSS